MSTTAPRRLRADAARNAERLVRTARATFAEHGIDVPLEEIARRANVGVATLYRRFPSKPLLLQAVLEACYAERVEPVIRRALQDEDGWRALVSVMEASLEMAADERAILTGLPEVFIHGLADRHHGALGAILARAQQAGQIRADIHPDDLLRLTIMLTGLVKAADDADPVWPRYLALFLDALRPAAATPLPPLPARPAGGNC